MSGTRKLRIIIVEWLGGEPMDLDCDSGEGIMKSDEEMGRDKPSGAGSNHNHYTSKYELLLLCDLVIILRVGEGVLEIAII